MALPCVNGCYLPKQETEFIHTVLEELDEFQQRNDILLFPPVPSRLRFLIHQTCANHPNLSTFSVGEGCARRVVVCCSDLRDVEGSSHGRARSRDRVMENNSSTRSLEPSFNSRQRARRPEKAIYVPRAMRHKIVLEHPNLKESSVESCSDVTKEPLVANQKPEVDSTGQALGDEEFVQLSRSGPSPWPPAWDQTVSFFTSLTLDDETDEKLNETQRISYHIYPKLKHGDITILNTCSDFPAYANIWLDPQEFGHIIEIYSFPAMFKTDDLLDAFLSASVSSEGGMKIKWVDNTHALGVFSSQLAATQALSIKHPILKTRALLEGSQKAKWKAARRPVKERPRTDTVVARRMVTRALGLRGRRFEMNK
uniref:R3H and coiled-coil domain-containing protein 1-like n=1 Tax=Sinocyclocheilus rhinocerous TaxID=307959 RepID=A0A673H0C1_9TELE